jgi:hypothetical protein
MIKKNIKNQMQDMKLKKTRSNSIQLTNRGSFCNFAKPTHILRWRREKIGGGEKLSLELDRALAASIHQPTV